MFRFLAAGAGLFCLFGAVGANAAPIGDCSFDSAEVAGRNDVVMCEPFESETWWADGGYVANSQLTNPPARADQMTYTSITSEGCKSGQCLKVFTPQGGTRSLSIHWPLNNAGIAPEEIYFRYYFKIGPNWTAFQCDANGGSVWPPAGKFWGIADARVNLDPGGQCGNGGASADGINCWSARGGFEGCGDNYASNNFPYDSTCEATPNARVRLGSYIYVPDNGSTTGAPGLWDNVPERSSLGNDYTSACRRGDPDNPDPACYCRAENNMYCGVGTGGQLVADKWYAIEMYVKMNTPGVADGILRGWVDDQLSFEKTNLLYRKPGHDNLHARTIWMNTYKGGVAGNCVDAYLYYDQMVVSTERIGAMEVGPRPNAPSNLAVE